MTSPRDAAPLTRDDRTLFRLGGVSALGVAVGYPIIVALFLLAGTAMPTGKGGEAWLAYLAGKEAVWWNIVALSVLTDVLWLAVAWALCAALREVDRTAVVVGAGLMALFVVLELSISWPSYAVLVDLSARLGAATTDAQRAAIVAAASPASAELSSHLLPFYCIFTPALGKLVLGLVMWRGGPFGRLTAGLGILEGALGLVAVLGPFVWQPLGSLIVPVSLLSGVWFLLVGLRLTRLAAGPAAPLAAPQPAPLPA